MSLTLSLSLSPSLSPSLSLRLALSLSLSLALAGAHHASRDPRSTRMVDGEQDGVGRAAEPQHLR